MVRLYELGPKAHVISEEDGVYEPLHRLGTEVEAGQLAGRIHFLANPGRAPVGCGRAIAAVVSSPYTVPVA